MQVPVLAVRQPWAGLIAAGFKTMEVRTYPAPKKHIGQKIAIYASRTKPDAADIQHVGIRRFLYDFSIHNTRSFPSECSHFGEIIAVATLETSQPCENSLKFSCQESKHWASWSYHDPGKTHFWGLADIQALKHPIPFKFPHGAVVWASAELETI